MKKFVSSLLACVLVGTFLVSLVFAADPLDTPMGTSSKATYTTTADPLDTPMGTNATADPLDTPMGTNATADPLDTPMGTATIAADPLDTPMGKVIILVDSFVKFFSTIY
jgi:hypothetical protein